MSRVGKNPVQIPVGVHGHDQPARIVTAKGKLGEQPHARAPTTYRVALEDGKVVGQADGRTANGRGRNMWGTIAEPGQQSAVITGVSEGFSQASLRSTASATALQIQGKTLRLQLGYSHDVGSFDSRRRDDCPRSASGPTVDRRQRRRQAAGRPGCASVIRGYPPAGALQGQRVVRNTSASTILRKEGKKK